MKRRNLGRVFFLAVLGCCQISCAPGRMLQAQGPFRVQWAEDAAILSTSRALLEAGDRLELIWPNFWRADQAFVLFEPGQGAFLFSQMEPGPPFQRVALPEIPALDGRTYGTRESVPGLSTSRGLYGFNSRFQWGSVAAPSVQITDSIAMTIEGMIHEAFHAFQDEQFKSQPRRQYLFFESDVLSDPRYIALVELERRVLADGLGSSGPFRVQKLREYVAIRAFREADLADGVATAERLQETIEGTAQYVGQMGVAFALERDPNDITQRLQEALRSPVELVSWEPVLSVRDRWQWLHRWRLYESGATISILLDELAPDWKAQVAAGLTTYDVLATLLSEDSSSVLDLDAILVEYEYDEVLEESRIAAERGTWPFHSP